jgi:hypothetical protein
VSEGFKNVAALLDHLNVDASNPLAVLTQVWTIGIASLPLPNNAIGYAIRQAQPGSAT